MSGTEDAKELDAMLDVAGPVATEMQTIELLEETLRVAKRTVEHGRVRDLAVEPGRGGARGHRAAA